MRWHILIIDCNRYERIVNRIKSTSREEDWKDAKKLLGWMVCAKRQLTWKEMQVALSLDIENQTLEYDDRHMRTHIQEICGSLVFMSGDRGKNSQCKQCLIADSDCALEVNLVHSTAKT
jgi:hypothetical protein